MNFKKYHVSKNLWNEDYTNISSTIIYRPLYVGDGTFTLSSTIPYFSNVANLFLLSGNVSTGASTSGNGVWINHTVTAQSDSGYVTVAYRNYSGTSSPAKYKTMLNEGSTPLDYEPYSSEVWHDISIYKRSILVWNSDTAYKRSGGSWSAAAKKRSRKKK